MKPVDRLYRGGRIEKRRVRQRPLGHVDKHPESVGNVLVQCPFQRRRQRLHGGVGIQSVRPTFDADQRGTGGDELAEGRGHVQNALSIDCQPDKTFSIDASQNR